MNPNGIVMMLAAIWLGCQLLGGDLIGRLNLL